MTTKNSNLFDFFVKSLLKSICKFHSKLADILFILKWGLIVMMNLFQAFQMMDQSSPFVEGSWDPKTHEPQYHDSSKVSEYYSTYKLQQPSCIIEGYISPYPSNNWDTSSGILQYVEDTSRLPALDQRIDPNRIFNSDIAALRALASDQNKITKMFEKKLTESLTDRGKFGLTEDDVNAMQALTAARNAIVGITKEQINIKKNIADIRLKQQQQQNSVNGISNNNGGGMTHAEFSKEFMDNMFNMPARTSDMESSYQAPSVDLEQASQVIDDLVPEVSDVVKYESIKPKTYVILGDTDDDFEFATFDSQGNLIPDYQNPTSTIAKVDRINRHALDNYLVEYDTVTRKELAEQNGRIVLNKKM